MAELRPLVLRTQNGKLLAEGEILRGEFGSITKQNPSEKDHHAK